MNFTQKIKILRAESGYTQKDFAVKLNCATISIQNYESNRKTPNGSLMQKLCNLFPQYALWLMTDIDDISSVKNQQPKRQPKK